ncbi:ArnT family glycosyltransferase [Stratiformator vulcanicus]|uniref:Uncharacterized protein n=1 Tax=Stratiformator vulcanicus TaxID=2527980 RepID=A0A517R292_9PLAN|nr:glycosyltransferase family 39 protein [Stratiformator vulcanicus]QDT37963.1 hypothetical protein Pan189_23470 [Stratiformator vulcanicus]
MPTMTKSGELISDARLIALARQRDVELFRPLNVRRRLDPLIVLLCTLPALVALTGRSIDLSEARHLLPYAVALAADGDSKSSIDAPFLSPSHGSVAAWIEASAMRITGVVVSPLAFLPSLIGVIASLVIIGRLGRILFRTRGGFFTALLGASSLPLLAQAQRPIPNSLAIAFALASMICAVSFCSDKPRIRRALAAVASGLFIGLSTLFSMWAGLFAALATTVPILSILIWRFGTTPNAELTNPQSKSKPLSKSGRITGEQLPEASSFAFGLITIAAVAVGVSAVGFALIPAPSQGNKPTLRSPVELSSPSVSLVKPAEEFDLSERLRGQLDRSPAIRQIIWLLGFMLIGAIGISRRTTSGVGTRADTVVTSILLAAILIGVIELAVGSVSRSTWPIIGIAVALLGASGIEDIANRRVRAELAVLVVISPGLTFEFFQGIVGAFPFPDATPVIIGSFLLSVLFILIGTRLLFGNASTTDPFRRSVTSVTVFATVIVSIATTYPSLLSSNPQTVQLRSVSEALKEAGRDLDCWVIGGPTLPPDFLLAAWSTRTTGEVRVISSAAEITSDIDSTFAIARYGIRTRRPLLIGGKMVRIDLVGRPLFLRGAEIHIDVRREQSSESDAVVNIDRRADVRRRIIPERESESVQKILLENVANVADEIGKNVDSAVVASGE